MSVITSHRLSYDGDIRELLGDILGENTAIRYDRDKKDYTIRTIPCAVDLTKCTGSEKIMDEWRKKGISIHTVVEPEPEKIEVFESKGYEFSKNEYSKGHIDYSFRRDLNDEELKAVLHEPVNVSDDGKTISWHRNYGHDDTPAYLISKTFSNIDFHYTEITESYLDADCILNNGEVKEDLLEEEKEDI